MTWVAASVVAGSTVLSGYMNSQAAQNAANTQAQGQEAAAQVQQNMFNTLNAQQAPFRATGYNALNTIGSLGSGTYNTVDANGNVTGTGTGSGYLTNQFSNADLNAQLAPNYQFQLQQGQMANQRAANLGGGAIGGNALQGLDTFTQNYAGNAYQQAFNNYQSQRSNIYNTLASIAGLGQTANSQGVTAGTNAANAIGNAVGNAASAQAAGTIGSTNALTGGITGAANAYYLNNLLGGSSGGNNLSYIPYSSTVSAPVDYGFTGGFSNNGML
jgi:hypothetical protein